MRHYRPGHQYFITSLWCNAYPNRATDLVTIHITLIASCLSFLSMALLSVMSLYLSVISIYQPVGLFWLFFLLLDDSFYFRFVRISFCTSSLLLNSWELFTVPFSPRCLPYLLLSRLSFFVLIVIPKEYRIEVESRTLCTFCVADLCSLTIRR